MLLAMLPTTLPFMATRLTTLSTSLKHPANWAASVRAMRALGLAVQLIRTLRTLRAVRSAVHGQHPAILIAFTLFLLLRRNIDISMRRNVRNNCDCQKANSA